MFNPNERQYRSFVTVSAIPNDDKAPAYQVKGRAVVFDSPTCLFEFDGVKYFEIIDRNAFNECDMSDVIMNYNHEILPSQKITLHRILREHQYRLAGYVDDSIAFEIGGALRSVM